MTPRLGRGSAGVRLREARVGEWWHYVTERQAVFQRRCILQQPAPWTHDPILTRGYFTNVYRETDRVTRDVILRVLESSVGEPERDRMFNILVYRVFNWPPTWTALGGYRPLREWARGWLRAERTMLRLQRQTGKVFTGAYMINAASGARFRGPGSKVRLWVERLRRAGTQWGAIWDAVAAAHAVANYAGALRALSQVEGVAGFTAQEVLQDACYTDHPVLMFRGTDGVALGPGAVLGSQEIVGGRVTLAMAHGVVRALAERQYALNETRPLAGPPLTWWNIEDTLCEFSKYRRIKRGVRPKRWYRVPTGDLSPWDGCRAYWKGYPVGPLERREDSERG